MQRRRPMKYSEPYLLEYWAGGLEPIYLESALARAQERQFTSRGIEQE